MKTRYVMNTSISEVSERLRVTRVNKDGSTETESLGWFAHFTTTTPTAFYVGMTKPEDLKPGPCRLVIETDSADNTTPDGRPAGSGSTALPEHATASERDGHRNW